MKLVKYLFVLFLLLVLPLYISCGNEEYTIYLECEELELDVTDYILKNKDSMPKLPVPSDDWYEFDGWYATKDGVEFKVYDGKRYLVDGGKFNPETYDIIGNSVTFYAKFKEGNINCFIDIKGNNEQFTDKTISLLYGGKIENLPSLSKDYSRFLGWYTMYNGKEILVHNGIKFMNGYDKLDSKHYEIVGYTTSIYAKYLSDDIKVIINGNSSEFNDTYQTVKYGESIDELTIPTKDNHEFIGWYTIKNGEEVLVYNKNGFSSNRNILNSNNYSINNAEVTIFAKYEVGTKQVELKLGNDVNAQSRMINVKYGDDITEYVKDIRIGGKLVTKWSTIMNDTTLSGVFVGPVVNDSIVLYPAENIYYLVTLKGDNVEYVYAEENQEIVLPNLEKSGYAFIGWESSNGTIHKEKINITKELVLEPKWLAVGTKSITVRNQGYSDPYIYTPKDVDKKPTKRDWEDVVRFSDYFDLEVLKANGYTGFTIKYSCEMDVIDDGYQHIYLYSDSQQSNDFLLYEKQYDNAEGTTNESFTTNIAFSKLINNYISIRYAASGYFSEVLYSHGNQWNCSKVVVTITPYK